MCSNDDLKTNTDIIPGRRTRLRDDTCDIFVQNTRYACPSTWERLSPWSPLGRCCHKWCPQFLGCGGPTNSASRGTCRGRYYLEYHSIGHCWHAMGIQRGNMRSKKKKSRAESRISMGYGADARGRAWNVFTSVLLLPAHILFQEWWRVLGDLADRPIGLSCSCTGRVACWILESGIYTERPLRKRILLQRRFECWNKLLESIFCEDKMPHLWHNVWNKS